MWKMTGVVDLDSDIESGDDLESTDCFKYPPSLDGEVLVGKCVVFLPDEWWMHIRHQQ